MNDYILGLMTGGIILLLLELAFWAIVAIKLPKFIKKHLKQEDQKYISDEDVEVIGNPRRTRDNYEG
jgi:hypothetical protein